jgi:hypothetical protein
MLSVYLRSYQEQDKQSELNLCGGKATGESTRIVSAAGGGPVLIQQLHKTPSFCKGNRCFYVELNSKGRRINSEKFFF